MNELKGRRKQKGKWYKNVEQLHTHKMEIVENAGK